MIIQMDVLTAFPESSYGMPLKVGSPIPNTEDHKSTIAKLVNGLQFPSSAFALRSLHALEVSGSQNIPRTL